MVRAQCPLSSPWITVLNPTRNRLSGLEFLWFPFSLQARYFETGHDHYLNTNPAPNKNRMWTGVWSLPHRIRKNLFYFIAHKFQKLIFKNSPILSSTGMEMAYMMVSRYIFKGLVFHTRYGQEFLSSPKTFSTVPGSHKTFCTMSTGAACKG